MHDRPRILIVTRNLPPLLGGMERLNLHMALQLSEHADVRVVGPGGSRDMLEGIPLHAVPHRPLPAFLTSSAMLAAWTAMRWRPDWVLAGSGLSAPMAWIAARSSGARLAIYVHGLDLAARHPAYRSVWIPAIRRADRVVANSRATTLLATRIGVPTERLSLVPPGVSMRARPSDARIAEFRMHYAPDGGPLLAFVGRFTERKGILQWVEACLPPLVAAYPGLVVLLAGEVANQALLPNIQSPADVQAMADRLGLGHHLHFMGLVSDDTKDLLLAAADVHVFPVRELPGDPEGFGMVAVEAAAQGTPTVAFAAGGIPDAVAHGISGRLVPSGDYAGMVAATLDLIADPPAVDLAMDFARGFEWRRFGGRIVGALGMRAATDAEP